MVQWQANGVPANACDGCRQGRKAAENLYKEETADAFSASDPPSTVRDPTRDVGCWEHTEERERAVQAMVPREIKKHVEKSRAQTPRDALQAGREPEDGHRIPRPRRDGSSDDDGCDGVPLSVPPAGA